MKKIFLIIMSFFIMLSLASCNNTNENNNTDDDTKTEYVIDLDNRNELLRLKSSIDTYFVSSNDKFIVDIYNKNYANSEFDLPPFESYKLSVDFEIEYSHIFGNNSYESAEWFIYQDDNGYVMAEDLKGTNPTKTWWAFNKTTSSFGGILGFSGYVQAIAYSDFVEYLLNLTKDSYDSYEVDIKDNLISVSVVKDSNKFDYYIYYKNNLIYEAKSFYNDDLELRISFDDESNIDYIYPNLDEFERYGGSDKPEENDLEEPLKEEEYLVDYDNNRTYYQILVYSFADSNGDGIGDFKGIADKLDYLVSLGVEGLWLSPILQADSYHSYDINNYYKINPKYCVTIDGTYYGINYLLKECHKRNIKVLMDLVLNHTSYFHSWYYLYEAWYSADNRFGYPELDYDNPGVVSAVKEVGNYWLQRGFDGFRLDAAMWIYNSGENRHQKNIKFWQDWCSEMKKTKPDCYLIGEVLDDDHDLAYAYNNCGFDSTFDFNALGSVINATTNNNYDYAKVTSENNKKALDENPSFIMARCLSNHDIGRFNQAHPDSNDKAYYVEDIKEIKLANAINALTPGNTFIYYGDELGLMGTCEDTRPNYYYDMNYRTPMPFTNGLTDSESYFESFHGSGITTSKTYSNKTIEEDIANSNSIYNALKNALALKNSSEILQKGTIKEISDLPSGLSGFDVTYNNQTIRILYISSNVTSSINYTIDGELLYNLGASVNNNTITISTCNLIAFTI